MASVPFWIWGNVTAGMLCYLLFNEKRSWLLILLNAFIILPGLAWLINLMLHGMLLSLTSKVWLAAP